MKKYEFWGVFVIALLFWALDLLGDWLIGLLPVGMVAWSALTLAWTFGLIWGLAWLNSTFRKAAEYLQKRKEKLAAEYTALENRKSND